MSICLTEEAPQVSTINPVNLVDKEWTDPYKLNKLMRMQEKLNAENVFHKLSDHYLDEFDKQFNEIKNQDKTNKKRAKKNFRHNISMRSGKR